MPLSVTASHFDQELQASNFLYNCSLWRCSVRSQSNELRHHLQKCNVPSGKRQRLLAAETDRPLFLVKVCKRNCAIRSYVSFAKPLRFFPESSFGGRIAERERSLASPYHSGDRVVQRNLNRSNRPVGSLPILHFYFFGVT